MKLILIRHGETVANKKLIVQGQTQGELNENGKEQARRLAERFKNIKLDIIFSSDLKRAVDTANGIAKHHPDTEQKTMPLLRERSYGVFEDKPVEFYIESKGKKSKYDYDHSSCEPCEKVEKRAEDFLAMLKKDYQEKTILAVSHGGFNRYIIGSAIRLPKHQRHCITQSNTCVNILEYKKDDFILNLLNCTNHLTALQKSSD